MNVVTKTPKQRSLTFCSERTVSARRAAKIIGFSHKKVIRLVEMGLLVGYRPYEGAWWQVEYESIVAFLNRMKTQPPE